VVYAVQATSLPIDGSDVLGLKQDASVSSFEPRRGMIQVHVSTLTSSFHRVL
jgi:hypothetical protein